LFCDDTNSVKGCKGRECCSKGRTTIHRSAVECTTNHRGVNKGRNTMKVDGDGVA
jgi:hypothetical protein